MRGPIMLSIQQCTVKSFRRLFSLPNHVTAANKRWSSTNEISEEFVRNVLLDENNKMEVVRRLEKLKMFKKPDRPLQKAAVLIPLCVCGGDLSILYTRRTPHMKANAGQPSFPGGKFDNSDDSIANTALRECKEEIGIPSENIDVWTTLAAVPDRLRVYHVYPVLSFIKNYSPKNLSINKDEVQDVFTVPVTRLLNPGYHGYTQFRNGWKMPVYKTSPTNVWGMTAIFTDIFLANAFPSNYKLIVKPSTSK